MYQQASFSLSVELFSLFLRPMTEGVKASNGLTRNSAISRKQRTNVDGEERLCVIAYETVPEFKRTSINPVDFCRHFFAPELCNVVLVAHAIDAMDRVITYLC